MSQEYLKVLATPLRWPCPRVVSRAALILLAALLAQLPSTCPAAETSTPPAPPAFQPKGLNAWDFWFTQDAGQWHAFYLEYPDPAALADQSQRHTRQWIGHAVSTDLVHWSEHATALQEPGQGIATGSVVRHLGRWYMLVTHRGFSLAESDDLEHWRWHEPRPAHFGPLKADWQGVALSFRLLADPYLYPEQIDGWWYAAINAHIVDAPAGQRGALALVRSRDLIEWEAHRIIAYPGRFERLETPQFWRHADRWYLHFGGVVDDGIVRKRNLNLIYSAAKFDGPYTAQPWSEIQLPGVARWYLGKRLELPSGDVFLAGYDYKGLSRPFRLTYEIDGAPHFTPLSP